MIRQLISLRQLIFLPSLVCALTCAAQPQYTASDSLRVTNLLTTYAAEATVSSATGTDGAIIHFARELLCVPYVAHTLEVNAEERLVVNLRGLDCTTYVETVLALAMCAVRGDCTFEGYCCNLQTLRYVRYSEPHYTTRLHYFTSWIEDNSRCGLCREVNEPSPPFTAMQTVKASYMTTHTNRYSMLAADSTLLPGIAAMERAISGRRYAYIPQEQLANDEAVRRAVHDGDIIAIVTTIDGLDTQHIGIAVWHDDGLHLLNASSIHKKVVEEPLTLQQYLYRHKTMPGIRVIRPLF